MKKNERTNHTKGQLISKCLFGVIVSTKIPMIYLFSCCQSDGRGGTQKLPDFCFEQNGCNGLWWLGADACSSHLVDSVANVLKSLKNPEIPKTIVSKRE